MAKILSASRAFLSSSATTTASHNLGGLSTTLTPNLVDHRVERLQQVRQFGYGTPEFTNWRMLNDHKRRVLIAKHYPERDYLVALKDSTEVPYEIQSDASQLLRDFVIGTNRYTLKDRCLVSSRKRAIFRTWRFARIFWRLQMDYNYISGGKRAIWGNRLDKLNRYDEPIKPDLRGTLAAIRPITPKLHHDLFYEKHRYRYVKPTPYNQNLLKKAEFVYPKPLDTYDPTDRSKLPHSIKPKNLRRYGG